MSECGEEYEIAFVEGSFTRPNDEKRLVEIREQAQIVVALGACACMGGVNAIRNGRVLENMRRYVYADQAETYEASRTLPVESIIPVEAQLPGCPIDGEEFIRAVKSLLLGKLPDIPDYPVCMECKLKENACLFLHGQACLGPIVRAGCGAICPSFGVGCEGCRGLIPNPNIDSLKEVMREHGISESLIDMKLSLFMTNMLMEIEVQDDGSR
jgi:sulfhydrogenase subunit delta